MLQYLAENAAHHPLPLFIRCRIRADSGFKETANKSHEPSRFTTGGCPSP